MAKTKATPTAAPEQSNTGDQDKVIRDLLNRIREIERITHGHGHTRSKYILGYISRMCDEALEKFSPISSEEEIPF